MKLEQLKALEKGRTAGPWHIGHIDEHLDRGEIENSGGVIIASDVKRDCEGFICAFANSAADLLAVVEAARVLEVDYMDAYRTVKGAPKTNLPKYYLDLFHALARLEGRDE